MKVGVQTKQPREEISVSINYDEALDPQDRLERVYGLEIHPPGELRCYPLLADKDRVRLFFSGGLNGTKYKVTLCTLTSGGEVLEDELMVKVKEI